ncbi:MAG: YbaK/EbsC family protein [Paracoccaceae bacterium]|jgi:prolyl-tRNA editing enzyme YbaK/EbsC (Cys-tRNA(Pro) deacylase)|nr:YbaK/EbsC family protein [Paracoccaceae bacterium]MDP7184166.1 YbaK/EbsC family protein [Paracoccaceae bacterium]
MSKSLKRVRRVLEDTGWETEIRETGEARTARMAADELGVEVDQIAKSIIFRGDTTGQALLFLTAGGNQVDVGKASALAGEPLGKADAALVRSQTGFAIGGVSPVGHLNPIRTWVDPRLLDFDVVWAAAGTPHHVFSFSPKDLLGLSDARAENFTVAL